MGLRRLRTRSQGCEQYQLFRALDNPDTLVLLERWTTQVDLDKHLEDMRARGGLPTTPFNAGNPSFEQYQVE